MAGMNRRLFLLMSLIVAMALLWVLFFLVVRPGGSVPFHQGAYVWQRSWNPEVGASVCEAAPHLSRLFPLVGEVRVREDGSCAMERVAPDWRAFVAADVAVVPVLRAGVSVARAWARGDGGRVAAFMADALAEAAGHARAAGARVAGLQLDYDCPTDALDDYRALLETLRAAPSLAGVPLSITALPDWLGSGSFGGLVAGLDHFVLQVHSLERPKSPDAPGALCDVKRIPSYLDAAERAGVAFYVALPTYAYKVAFDAKGAFIGLSAEGPEPDWPPDAQLRIISADAGEMAALVKNIQARSRRHLHGVLWFRLPVKGERRNWTWPTLHGVMQGQAPPLQLEVRVDTPEPGLLEVHVENMGGVAEARRVRITIKDDVRVAASDGINGYAASGPLELEGPAPLPGERVFAGWFRVVDKDANKDNTAIESTVEVIR